MAIFTGVANYLKCRYYFESVLGFKLVEKYPDETQEDWEADISGFRIDREHNTGDPNIDSYGIFCRRSNRIIARNIWFLYGKSKPWGNYEKDNSGTPEIVDGEVIPPKESEVGFAIRDMVNGNISDGACCFILDPKSMVDPVNPPDNSDFEFIGMKRLLPVDDDGTDASTNPLNNPDNIGGFKTFVEFRKLGEGASETRLENYTPVSPTPSALNSAEPNSLVIKTCYDYEDFGFSDTNKEYNVRQIGMLTNLHIKDDVSEFIANRTCLFNGMSDNPTRTEFLCTLFDINDNSIEMPSGLVVDDRFTSIVGDIYSYSGGIPAWLKNELNINGSGRTNTAVDGANTFFGILQFYINTMPNNRFTYQKDTYNFILSFENQLKCSCTCENCECHKS